MKIITTLLIAVMLWGCSTTGMQSASTWLQDPKNQQLIEQIAQTAISLIGAFGAPRATTYSTVIGQLSAKYPDVPAGALREIAGHPYQYKRGVHH